MAILVIVFFSYAELLLQLLNTKTLVLKSDFLFVSGVMFALSFYLMYCAVDL